MGLFYHLELDLLHWREQIDNTPNESFHTFKIQSEVYFSIFLLKVEIINISPDFSPVDDIELFQLLAVKLRKEPFENEISKYLAFEHTQEDIFVVY